HDGGRRARDRGDARDVVGDRRAADLVPVHPRAGAVWRVDDQADLARLDHRDRVAAVVGVLEVLGHDLAGDAVPAQDLTGTGGGDDLEAEVGQALDREDHAALVAVGDGPEDLAAGGQRAVDGRLRLGERVTEAGIDTHHFTRRLHLRAEEVVDALAGGG